ncbi:hypothetical protein FE236_00510 [Mariprofundus erugo]|uniref:DUF6908 domain-containing protein n=1 Tax=Mariprofundus erugo TaxID=2528639 RepID=UPI0010FDFD57|nr:hypothetical protein [Mariprofundus erugo]TLS78276.1 hypothetical protein FE236_00510 [Mariprofundus erugo]
MSREERIYSKMLKIYPDLKSMQVGDHRKISNDPFMALSLDVLADHPIGRIIALAHNSEMNGDLMADPDMQILINLDLGKASPMTYQNDWLGVYQESLSFTDDGDLSIQPALLKDLTEFLDMWTQNLLDQGFAEASADQEAAHGE